MYPPTHATRKEITCGENPISLVKWMGELSVGSGQAMTPWDPCRHPVLWDRTSPKPYSFRPIKGFPDAHLLRLAHTSFHCLNESIRVSPQRQATSLWTLRWVRNWLFVHIHLQKWGNTKWLKAGIMAFSELSWNGQFESHQGRKATSTAFISFVVRGTITQATSTLKTLLKLT